MAGEISKFVKKLASNSGVDIGDVDVLSIAAGDNNIGNVDIASALPAGTNAIGKLAANTGVDIGDVDILSIAAGDNNIGNVDIASALPAGTNAIGKLAANSGVDIGDVDVLSIAAGTNLIGKVSIDQVTANANEVVVKAGTAVIGKVGHDVTGLGHGVTTVTTAGTDVVLASSTACKWAIIQAQTDNTDKMAVGASGVDATVATGTGIILDPGDSITILTDNLADIYIDSLVNGEGVRYTYGT